MDLLLQSHPPEMHSVLLIPVKIIIINITRLYRYNVKSDHTIRFSKINENRIVPSWASEGFFPGGPKVVKFVFYPSKLKKQPFFANKFKIHGGSLSPPLPPSDALA